MWLCMPFSARGPFKRESMLFVWTLHQEWPAQGCKLTQGMTVAVGRLQVCDRLAERNRRLRQVHAQLGRVVVYLMQTDLVRHKDRCGAEAKWSKRGRAPAANGHRAQVVLACLLDQF
jgi:hypothetical protein